MDRDGDRGRRGAALSKLNRIQCMWQILLLLRINPSSKTSSWTQHVFSRAKYSIGICRLFVINFDHWTKIGQFLRRVRTEFHFTLSAFWSRTNRKWTILFFHFPTLDWLVLLDMGLCTSLCTLHVEMEDMRRKRIGNTHRWCDRCVPARLLWLPAEYGWTDNRIQGMWQALLLL